MPKDVALVTPIADERRRLLENQVSFTDTVRNRTTAMLSVASIVAGLFGAKFATATSTEPRPTLAAIAAALFLFAVSAILAVGMMMLKGVNVGVNTSELLARLEADTPSTAYGMTYTLAKRYQEEYDLNVPTVNRLDARYRWLCVLVGAQVIAWAAATWI